jgi:hypothetical protein
MFVNVAAGTDQHEGLKQFVSYIYGSEPSRQATVRRYKEQSVP